jgi:hypothetical protein
VRIPLTQSQFTLIDADDYARIAKYTWTVIRSNHTMYAKANVDGRAIYMHRLIALGDNSRMDSLKVDHKNRNGLDNRKRNLRAVTHRMNLKNSTGKASVRKSKFKGVSPTRHSTKQVFRATIQALGKQRHLGYFSSEEEAARAYDRATLIYFGRQAWLNFPNEHDNIRAPLKGVA